MDFSKLNLEFSNMQKIVSNYNEILNKINCKIKNNLKLISKYKSKTNGIKNVIEKDINNLHITILKEEIDFLNELIKEEIQNEKNV